jgi:foldase protein PrsA
VVVVAFLAPAALAQLATPVAVVNVPSTTAVAVVNGRQITEADWYAHLRKATGRPVLAQMIETQIIRDAFAKAGLTITEEDVQQDLTKNFGSVAAFRRAAAQVGISGDDYIEDSVKPRIMLERLATKDVPYTEADLQGYYEENQDRYNVAASVTLRQIVVPDQDTAATVATGLEDGTDFTWLVRRYSTDPGTRENGGLVANLPLGEVRPELAQALADLKEGDCSAPFQVGNDWMIVKLEKRQAAETRDYEQARADVLRDYLRSKLDQAALQAMRNRLHAWAKVEILAPDMQSLAEQFQEAPPPGPAPAAPAH